MNRIKILICLLFGSFIIQAQNYYMSNPEGFGENTTGGGSSSPVIVDNYNAFKSMLLLSSPQVILVSGTIVLYSGQNISEVVTNKTIIGLPGARLVNNTQTQSGSGILNLKNGSNNVIIRNLIFEGPGAYDIDGRDNLSVEGCTNLWVDHCEFQDGLDGNFDIKNNSDNITVSWCKFTYLKPAIPGGSGGSNDHRFSNLIGSSDSNAPNDGHFSITFQNCYWAEGCKERMPRARNAELHILNCYYNTDVSNSRALGFSGGVNSLSCYVENSDFANVGTVYQSYGGTVALEFDNCINSVSNIGSVNAPSYSYSVIPVEDVATYIPNTSCGAGATLQVTNSGVISSSCDNLSIEESSLSSFYIYPSIVKDKLYLKNFSPIIEQGVVSVIDVNGKIIKTDNLDFNHNQDVELDFSSIVNGLYFVKVDCNNISRTYKIVKSK